jgi:hypothetical protein
MSFDVNYFIEKYGSSEVLKVLDLDLLNKLEVNNHLESLIQLYNKATLDPIDYQALDEILNTKKDEELVTASLRAPEGYDLPGTMQKFSNLFIKAGGHKQAAGFSAKKENIDLIRQNFEKYLKKESVSTSDKVEYLPLSIQAKLPEEMKTLIFDKRSLYIEFSDLNTNFLKQIVEMEPFGIDFPEPFLIFLITKKSIGEIKFYDKNQIFTAKIKLINGIDLVIFRLSIEAKSDIENFVNNNQSKELIIKAKSSPNEWNGSTTYQLLVDDFRII